jgi:hypothetical protein
MRTAGVSEPSLKRYTKCFHRLAREHELADLPVNIRSSIMFICSDPARLEALRQIRERMTPAQLARLTNPISAAARVSDHLKRKAPEPPAMLGDSESLSQAIGRLYKRLVARDGRVGSARVFGAALAETFEPLGLLALVI